MAASPDETQGRGAGSNPYQSDELPNSAAPRKVQDEQVLKDDGQFGESSGVVVRWSLTHGVMDKSAAKDEGEVPKIVKECHPPEDIVILTTLKSSR